MHSYADRLRAVELYIRLGKRVKATIRQLGYPTKNALKGWYRDEQRFDLCVRDPVRTPRIFRGLETGGACITRPTIAVSLRQCEHWVIPAEEP